MAMGMGNFIDVFWLGFFYIIHGRYTFKMKAKVINFIMNLETEWLNINKSIESSHKFLASII